MHGFNTRLLKKKKKKTRKSTSIIHVNNAYASHALTGTGYVVFILSFITSFECKFLVSKIGRLLNLVINFFILRNLGP